MGNEHLGILGCYFGAPVASLHSTTTEPNPGQKAPCPNRETGVLLGKPIPVVRRTLSVCTKEVGRTLAETMAQVCELNRAA